MHFNTWDLVINIFLLTLWIRIWSDNDRAAFFNPYLAPLYKISDHVLRFVRTAVPFHPKVIAALLIVVVILLRGLAVPPQVDWRIVLGFERQAAGSTSILAAFLFSALSFAVFLFKIWGISLIYVRGSHPPVERSASTLYELSRPFADIQHTIRPFVLFIIGIIIAGLMDITGHAPPSSDLSPYLRATLNWNSATPFVLGVELSLLSLAGWVNLLLVLQQIMIVLIIGSWISMFAQAPMASALCRDWMNMLLGPLRRYPMRVGMFDLSPIVFFIGIQFIHSVLMGILMASYHVLT